MSRRLGALLAVGAVPWLVVPQPGAIDLVFAWGLFAGRTGRFVSLFDYLFIHTLGPASLPGHLLAWPLAVLFYLITLASAALSVVGREDRRVTAVLLALAGAMGLRLWWGLPSSSLTIPLGAALLFVFVWWFHAGDLRRVVPGAD